MGSQIRRGPACHCTRLIPLRRIAIWGEWKEGLLHEGLVMRSICRSAARYDSMVDTANPWVPKKATNRVIFSMVIGLGEIE